MERPFERLRGRHRRMERNRGTISIKDYKDAFPWKHLTFTNQAICPWWRSERYGRHIPETRLLEAVWFYETSNKVQNKWIELSCSKLKPPKKSLIALHVNLFIYRILHNVLLLISIVVSVWTSITVRYNLYHTANYAGLDNLFFFSYSNK